MTDTRRRTFRRTLRTLAAAPLLALLAGCGSLLTPSGPTDPMAPEGGVLMSTLTAAGTQQFQCAADKQGRWWKFIAPDVELRDAAGHVVAHQGADFIFRASDGSVASAKIVKWDKHPKSAENLRDVLFQTTARGKKSGLMTGVRWVSRTEGKGGQPLAACSPSQLGSTMKIPFTATYRFYR